MLLTQCYLDAKVLNTGRYQTTLNELCDQVPALRPQLLWQAALELVKLGEINADKILSEEDKGAPIATAVSLITGLPLCMARWYPYEIPGQVSCKIKNEYFQGNLYLNGVEPGDRVLIIEDTISTGGTLIALAEAVEACGGVVVEARAVVEKVRNRGREAIAERYDFPVSSVMQIEVQDGRVTVLS
jgi:adenine phosphoribosyltransferase